ncbi:hypothetical protein BJ741DRAFT_618152 [Chytriomyces cf. hyalinus JEL632]|nr:hypothetical protein BJ741DRAFT_618152 [Chytriomyces cf. hyalinus JEL632]
MHFSNTFAYAAFLLLSTPALCQSYPSSDILAPLSTGNDILTSDASLASSAGTAIGLYDDSFDFSDESRVNSSPENSNREVNGESFDNSLEYIQVVTLGGVVIMDTPTLIAIGENLRLDLDTLGSIVQQIGGIDLYSNLQEQVLAVADNHRVSGSTVVQVARIVLNRLPTNTPTRILNVFEVVGRVTMSHPGQGSTRSVIIITQSVQLRIQKMARVLGISQEAGIRIMKNTLESVRGVSYERIRISRRQVNETTLQEVGTNESNSTTINENSNSTTINENSNSTNINENSNSTTSVNESNSTNISQNNLTNTKEEHTEQINILDALQTIVDQKSAINTLQGNERVDLVGRIGSRYSLDADMLVNLASNTLDEVNGSDAVQVDQELLSALFSVMESMSSEAAGHGSNRFIEQLKTITQNTVPSNPR